MGNRILHDINELLDMNNDELRELLVEDPLYSNKGNLRILIYDLIKSLRSSERAVDYYMEENARLEEKLDTIRQGIHNVFEDDDDY